MQFEETELGLKQSAGVNGDIPQPDDNDAGSSEKGGKAKEPSPRKQKAKYSRESLPPAWAIGSASLGNTSAPRLLVNNKDVGPTDGGPRRGSQADMAERGKDRKVSDEREVRKDGHWVQQRRSVTLTQIFTFDANQQGTGRPVDITTWKKSFKSRIRITATSESRSQSGT